MSIAFAIPIAAIDADRIDGWLEVRPASGQEHYLTFSGETEHPQPGEITFVDAAGRAHARRWTNRQSGYSAVGVETRSALIVAEGLHPGAAADVAALVRALGAELQGSWGVVLGTALLTASAPRFEF